MRIGFLKAHGYGLAVYSIATVVSVFIAVLVARTVNVAVPEMSEIVHDTVFIQQPVTDSILQDIDVQVKEINSKITVKKTMKRKPSKRNDTIKVDAVIHIDNKDVPTENN